MPKCGNPECGKTTPKGIEYCDQKCLEHSFELKKQQNEKPVPESTTEAVLKCMGIEKINFSKDVAYRHWERFLQFLRDNSGKNWDDFIKRRLRSYIGIDYRYLEDFLESCLSWGVVEAREGNLYFIGVPKQETKNAT